MSDRRNSREADGDRAISSLGVLFARFFGSLLGPMFLVLTTMGIVNSGSGWFTKLDALFACLVVLTVASRWVEQRSGSATTGSMVSRTGTSIASEEGSSIRTTASSASTVASTRSARG